MSTNNQITLSNENKGQRDRNERTGSEEVVTLEVVLETEDVEVVLELNLEVVDPVAVAEDRIPERMPNKSVEVVDVVGVFLSLSFAFGGVGGVRIGSKKMKRDHLINLNSKRTVLLKVEGGGKNTNQVLATPTPGQLSLDHGEILSCRAMQIAASL